MTDILAWPELPPNGRLLIPTLFQRGDPDTAIVPLDEVGTVWEFEVTQDPEELPDDAIVPDNTDPLPPDPEVKTDPVDDE